MQFIKSLLLVVFFFFVYSVNAQKPPVELPGTEVVRFQSAIDTQEYILYINLPGSYKTSPGKKYPVLYVTDGQWFFNPLYAGYGGQHYDNMIPDLILVGITWKDNYGTRRARDFTPTHMGDVPNSGNAAKFLSVIKKEVIKYIDSAYRTDPADRGLYGTSYGGLFAIYALFNDPAFFNRYIIISPALAWDNDFLYKYEKSFAEKHRELNAKLFIAYGSYEKEIDAANYFGRFVNQVKASNYKGLEMESMVIDRMGHSGAGSVGGIIGLQSVYMKTGMVVDTSLLDQYTGHYEQGVEITRKGPSIYISMNGLELKMLAESPERFIVKGMNGTGEFNRDKNGKVTGYTIHFEDNSFFAKKID